MRQGVIIVNTNLKAPFLFLVLLFVSSVSTAATININAQIDGTSDLWIQGNTAQWHHYNADPPGQWNGSYPTVINGANWYPTGMSNNCGGCTSDVFNGVAPALPAVSQIVTLVPNAVRENAYISQQPNAGNGYTLIVRFDDIQNGGADFYDVDLNFSDAAPQQIPALNPAGLMIMAMLALFTGIFFLCNRNA